MAKRKVTYEVRVESDTLTAADIQWAIDRAIGAGGTTEANVTTYFRNDQSSIVVTWGYETDDD